MRHVAAMTQEGLHNKSEIAAELAHRDLALISAHAEIRKLKAEVNRLLEENNKLKQLNQ